MESLDVALDDGKSGLTINFNYVKRVPAILKIVEFFLLLFSFSLAAGYNTEIRGSKYFEDFETDWSTIHLVVCIIAWFGCIFLFLMYFLNIINILKEKIPVFTLLMFLHGIGTVCLLLSTILVIYDCVQTRGLYFSSIGYVKEYCDYISEVTSTSCAQLEASAAFGFFAFLAVLFDTFLHILKWLQVRRIQMEEAEEAKKRKREEREQNISNYYAS